MILIRLYWEFFKTGLFAVGGGLATLPFLQDISQRTGWFSLSDLTDMIAVSESTPGPIGVNMATFAGFRTAGLPGAVVASLGLITPSVIIILIVAGFLKKFKDSPYVAAVFSGLRPASTALIAAVCLSLLLSNFLDLSAWQGLNAGSMGIFKWKELLLGAACFLAIRHWKKLHPGFFLLAGAVAGILLNL